MCIRDRGLAEKEPIRAKSQIILNDKTLEQIKDFKYLDCDISFDYSKDIHQKN